MGLFDRIAENLKWAGQTAKQNLGNLFGGSTDTSKYTANVGDAVLGGTVVPKLSETQQYSNLFSPTTQSTQLARVPLSKTTEIVPSGSINYYPGKTLSGQSTLIPITQPNTKPVNILDSQTPYYTQAITLPTNYQQPNTGYQPPSSGYQPPQSNYTPPVAPVVQNQTDALGRLVYDASGKKIQYATSSPGFAGTGYSYTPPVSGLTGDSGKSAGTGLLEGVSSFGVGAGSGNVYNPNDEEKKKTIFNKPAQWIPGQIMLDANQQPIAPTGSGLTLGKNEGGGTIATDASGNTYNPAVGGFMLAKEAPQAVVSPPSITNKGVIDLTPYEQSTAQIMADFAKMKAGGSAVSPTELSERIRQTSLGIQNEMAKSSPLPTNPVPNDQHIIDTSPPQLKDDIANKLSQLPLDYKESIFAKYDIPNRITEIENMRKQIVAESQAYDQELTQIKSNPDLPKALANRMITKIENAKNINLQAIQYKLGFLVDNYNTSLERAKYDMGLYETAYNQQIKTAENQRDNNRLMIQQLITTGALGNVSDLDLQNFSKQTGYSYDSLKTMRKAVSSNSQLKTEQAYQKMENDYLRLQLTSAGITNTQEQRNFQNWLALQTLDLKKSAQENKPPTASESTALSFYNRAKDAENTIAGLENQISQMGLIGQARLQYLPNFLQPETNQLYRQAQREFTEARLRKESGAAIADSEYAKDAMTYFAQPGDTKATLDRKRAARQLIISGLQQQAGRAYTQSVGQESTDNQPIQTSNTYLGDLNFKINK